LAVAAALAGAAAPSADAAGLGRLTVESGLGQPLRAEVEVTALSRDEAASLNARLASPDAFRQAGLEYNPALAGLRFAIDRRPNGTAVVRITSSQPINEPFVDLLVELNWASGKFVREYTFLLDPPELRTGRESVAGGPVQVVPPMAAPAPSPQVAPVPAAQGTSTPAVAAPQAASPAAPAPAAAAPAAARTAAAPSAPAGSAPGEVLVRSGETLAGIAGRVKPADVSLDQAIIAIYNANPDAFFGSVHQMLAGKRLDVPDRATMAAVDAAAATRQIRAQAADFRAYRERLAAATRRVEPTQAGQSAAGTVGARVDDSGAGAGAGDQLKLSAGAGAAAGAAAAGTATGGSDAAAEAQVARDAAVREQQERVAALEKNVADLQQLLELKNRQLAELQQQVEAAGAAGATAAGTIGAASSAAAQAGAPSQPSSAAASDSGAPAGATGAAPSLAADAAPPATTASETTTPSAATPPPAAQPVPAPAPAGSFMDDLLANPLTLPGLGALALALGAYGFYSVRRRRKAGQVDEDSLIAADAFTANSLFGSTGGQAVDTNNSLFATSTRDSGVDIHSTEVDPIAEAEVYIAYGREAQAEEILKEALKKQPERQAIRLKLLEIYAGRKDPVAFGAVAQEMYDMAGGQNEEWPKVVTLGLSIDPANPLYTGQGDVSAASDAAQPDDDARSGGAGGAAAAGLAAAAAAAATTLGERMQPDEGVRPAGATGSFAETVPMDGQAEAGDDVPALDFDLDLDTTIGRAASLREASGSEPVASASESELARAIDGRFDLPSLELDGQPAFDDAGAQSADARSDEPPALADLGDFKIDLPSLEGLDTRPAIDDGASSVAAVDFSRDLSSGDVGLAAVETAVAPVVDSSRWQEMATKLDLASAYEEIGDKEGARELLEEVLRGGDVTQQQKARSMLSKIG
jgi:pilus assembly protein FimV